MLHHFRPILTATALMVASTGALAQTAEADRQAKLFDALGLPEMLEIMREEGLVYGEEIGADLFGDRINPEWDAIVSDIYDADMMRDVIAGELTAELADTDITPIIDFFTTEPGRTIVGLEVSARRALLDDAVEEASKEAAALAMMDETARYEQVKTYIDVNDLVETNVVGALNANYAFYIGLLDGGAFPAELTEEQILTDVWNQEEEIRSNTTEWVFSFLLMAYQPLSDDDMQAYIAFSQTDGGEDLNTALFAAFDTLFEGISRNLGLASAQYMIGDEI